MTYGVCGHMSTCRPCGDLSEGWLLLFFVCSLFDQLHLSCLEEQYCSFLAAKMTPLSVPYQTSTLLTTVGFITFCLRHCFLYFVAFRCSIFTLLISTLFLFLCCLNWAFSLLISTLQGLGASGGEDGGDGVCGLVLRWNWMFRCATVDWHWVELPPPG